MHANELILYVADQARARWFYALVLAAQPSLDVPGMTEFDLGGVTLGLMPAADMGSLVPGLVAGDGQRCELYLRRADADAILSRIVSAGGTLLSPLQPRPWGERVGYGLDLDGHVLAVALAEAAPSPTT